MTNDKVIKIVAKKMDGSFQDGFLGNTCAACCERCGGERKFAVWPDESFADFMTSFCKFLEKLNGGDYQVDVESFLKSLTHIEEKSVLFGLVFAINYATCLPYSQKTILKKPTAHIVLSRDLDKKFVQEIDNLVTTVNQVRRLQDIPSDLMFPISFVEEIEKICAHLSNVKKKALNRDEMKKLGMNLLLGVNKGSDKQPRLLVLEYFGNPNSSEIYGLVGKGITFDSGGMNIKTQSHMSTMKFDMSGAAIACGTLIALAKNKIKTNVVAIAALTENSIGPSALRPDDILVSYDGKTVQIDNTDAEGRLVLADAITYARKHYQLSRIYDIATLTGAVEVCFGDVYTGVWSTDDAIWDDFKHAADLAGELVWRMPLHPEYLKVLETKIADMSNISNRNYFAGSSVAAAFLSAFRGTIPLVHLDIASTAVSREKTGTGVMVRTLYNVCKRQH